MNDRTFKLSPVAKGIAMALGATTMTPAIAQQPSEAIEEITVTGIRSSLTSAMNMKRDGQGVVDGLVAEDIGKFPDTNLAEALQRISGVSIDRSAIGEGQQITVRGVGPDFNLVTLNGRQMPASSIEDTSASDSRAFDFANLASEAVSAIEISKTSRAELPTGGIGAVVNIITTRPLDNPDTVASIGAKAVIDQSVDRGDSVTPEISGIYSTSNDAETFGISLTGSYQDRSLGYNQAVVTGYRPFPGDAEGWGTIPLPGTETNTITNRPALDDIYSVPQETTYSFNEVDRERINGQLTLQFRPIETLTGTVDYTYSENTLETTRSSVGAWFNFLNNEDQAWTDGPAAAPTLYSEGYGGGGTPVNDGFADACFSAGEFAQKNENNSLGLNLKWDPTDRLGLEFDYHDSDAESRPDSPFGNSAVQGACGFFRGTTTVDYSGEFPALTFEVPAGQTGVDAAQMLQTGRSFRNSLMESDVEQARLSGEFYFEDESSLDFGVMMTTVNNRSAFSNVQTDSWGGFGTPDDYPDAIWGDVRSVTKQFDNAPIGGRTVFPEYFDFNFEDVRQAGIAVNGGDESSFLATTDYTTDRRTEEESFAAYLQYNRSFDVGANLANIALGLRYEQTDVTSSALVPNATGIVWVAANEFTTEFDGSTFTTLKGDYDYLLPNVDFNVEIGDEMIVRASYSQTIGRPEWGDIQGGQTLAQLVRIDFGSGNQGDPGLKPLESKNYDVSFEWYYTDSSYFSVGYFFKDIDNYVGISQIQDTPFNLPHPGQGARFLEAQAAVGTDLVDIRNYIFENYGDTPEVTVTGVDANGDTTGTIAGIAGEDPAAVYNITVPSNQESAEVDGWEIALQHMFGDTGFGFSANVTFVDSDRKYDNSSLESQFAIEGISDSANVVAFYETDIWSARLAYNWRDEFLSGRFDGLGISNPQYTDDYGQLDINVSYNWTDYLTIFAEGINVTDETQTIFGRNKTQTYFWTQTGARYMIGARYDFM